MSFLTEYGLFLAKTLTLVIAIFAILAGIFVLRRHRDLSKGSLSIVNINKDYEETTRMLNREVLSEQEYKMQHFICITRIILC